LSTFLISLLKHRKEQFMPARALKGLVTESGWQVTEEINQKLGSGGNFCCRYNVESAEGKVGFLKAMDITKAVAGGIREIQNLANQYVFEQDILYYCKKRKMTKVVTPLDAGEIQVPNFKPPLNTVYYVIFEKADGDLRQEHFDVPQKSWLSAFKALHHVSIGAHQLHQAGIAHQDIKPSNVLRFKGSESKISDLGRVTDASGKSPFNAMDFTGDRSYAPPEIEFGFTPGEFVDRYYADIYMLGSLAYHLVCDAQMAYVLYDETKKINPIIRTQSYQDALPFMHTAFSTILQRYQRDCTSMFGHEIAKQLRAIVAEMCNPDISKRGAPNRTNKALQLSMNRYVGKFATLVRTAIVKNIR